MSVPERKSERKIEEKREGKNVDRFIEQSIQELQEMKRILESLLNTNVGGDGGRGFHDVVTDLAMINSLADYEQHQLERTLNDSLETYTPFEKNPHQIVMVDKKLYRNIEEDVKRDNNRCHICLNNYRRTDYVSKLSDCSHLFHFKCIRKWGKYKPECPLCKTPLLVER